MTKAEKLQYSLGFIARLNFIIQKIKKFENLLQGFKLCSRSNRLSNDTDSTDSYTSTYGENIKKRPSYYY